MSCPICKSIKLATKKSMEFSNLVVQECYECETVFLLENGYKKILYVREH